MIGLAFTSEQFKTLLRMIYVANTVASIEREEEGLQEYDELEQYIFSRAGDAGFPAATWKHKALAHDGAGSSQEHHHPSRIFENDPELHKLMGAYDALVATELLAEKLAERDIEKKHGIAAKTQMPEKDYEELLDAHIEQYENEFEEFGFARLILEKNVVANESTLKQSQKIE